MTVSDHTGEVNHGFTVILALILNSDVRLRTEEIGETENLLKIEGSRSSSGLDVSMFKQTGTLAKDKLQGNVEG